MIKKYTDISKIYEAIQYTGKNSLEIQEWSENFILESPVLEPSQDNPSGEYMQISNTHAERSAIPNDYIVKYPDDTFHVWTEELFFKLFRELKNG